MTLETVGKFALFVLCLLVGVYGLFVVSSIATMSEHNADYVLINTLNFILFIFFVLLAVIIAALVIDKLKE